MTPGGRGFPGGPLRRPLAVAGAVLLAVVILAVAEQMGLPDARIGHIFLGLTITLFAAAGLLSRLARSSAFPEAAPPPPAIVNGMATGSDWVSAASFIGLAGAIYALGHDALAYILGWTGGYVLLALFIVPALGRSGHVTVPDYLGARFGGGARGVGTAATLAASFAYLVAQVTGVVIVVGRLLQLDFTAGVFAGLAAVLFCALAGGRRTGAWSRMGLYVVLGVAYLAPVVALSLRAAGVPIPQSASGQVPQRVDERQPPRDADPRGTGTRELRQDEAAGIDGLTSGLPEGATSVRSWLREAGARAGSLARPVQPRLEPFARLDPVNVLGLTFCLMIGAAGLPHVLMRHTAAASARGARASIGWALAFICLTYFAAPAVAAFARHAVLEDVVGLSLEDLPAWLTHWGKLGLLSFRDFNADGVLQLHELAISPDAITLALPEIARLPAVLFGLVAAGGLAAALLSAEALLLTISGTLTHGLLRSLVDAGAGVARRRALTRGLLALVALAAVWVASLRLATIVELVAWAFSIAAASLFPALAMGLWDRRANRAGALAGMSAGFCVCLLYLVGSRFFGLDWFGIRPAASGLFGVPAGFLAIYVVSRMTAPPPREVQAGIEPARIRGGVAAPQLR